MINFKETFHITFHEIGKFQGLEKRSPGILYSD